MPSSESIGRYEVRQKIAQGGMGTVYLGHDPKLRREVAIKVLLKGMQEDPEFRKRFDREAKIIAQMDHPAIVQIYDFGEENGQPYIVMKYMGGGTLDDRLKSGRLSLPETARIITRLAPALDAAHELGVVHRDIKPGNILFDRYADAYLTDFGIARSLSAETTLTGRDSIVGTPNYMSPEQVQGDKQLDGRSDIYSLGVVIFHMLTGAPPYKGNTPWSIMLAHVNEPIPQALQACCDLPPEVDQILTRAMAKKPAERYQSVTALARDLQNLADQVGAVTRAEIPSPANVTLASTPTQVNPKDIAPPPLQVPTPLSVAPGGAAAAPTLTGTRRIQPGMLAAFLLAALVLLLGGGLAAQGLRGAGPLAFLAPTATQQPSATAALPTDTTIPSTITRQALSDSASDTPVPPTPEPATATATAPQASDTPEPTPTPKPDGPVIGGADRIAYLAGNEIWVAKMNGSDAEQITQDGVAKNDIGWTPDGQSLVYLSGQCVYTVPLAGGERQILTCFNFAEKLQAFEISPDGNQVAINIDNQLHILPYDVSLLRSIAVRDDLANLAGCKDFAPYARYRSEYAHWSGDSRQMALMIWGAAHDIGSADTVHTISLEKCTNDPDVAINFPPPHFIPSEYKVAPNIPSFAWDGLKLYVMNTLIRNNGFGKLYEFNADQYKAKGPLSVVSECCYRDPVFTPDGGYLLFAYQRYPIQETTEIFLYLVNIGSLGTGEKYQPLALPAIDGKSQPMPALRPAR